MIRSETEYQEAVRRHKEERARLAQHRQRFKGAGLSRSDLKRDMDPLRSFHLQLEEEIQSYERLRRGELDELVNLLGWGVP